MYQFSISHTLLLILPYLIIWTFYHFKNKDNFFLRAPAYRKIDLYIQIFALSTLLFLIWNSYFSKFLFLGLKISKDTIFFNDKFITFLGISLAVIGVLFTIRTQLTTNMKNHSIQTIMNTRLSEYYNQQITEVEKILVNKTIFSLQDYDQLDIEKQRSISYLLNYYEFLSIGVRYNELDEKIVKKMTRSQLLKTYKIFEPLIQHFQSCSGLIKLDTNLGDNVFTKEVLNENKTNIYSRIQIRSSKPCT